MAARMLALVLMLSGCAEGDRFNAMPQAPMCFALCFVFIVYHNNDVERVGPDK